MHWMDKRIPPPSKGKEKRHAAFYGQNRVSLFLAGLFYSSGTFMLRAMYSTGVDAADTTNLSR